MGDATDEEVLSRPYRPLYAPVAPRPVILHQRNSESVLPFLARPFTAPVLLHNEQSDVRDHCANERTFLSWLRLSIYLAVVAAAIIVSFHLKQEPTPLERKASIPLGLIFWVLSAISMVSGLTNYVSTVTRYSRRQALVQSGWKTEALFTTISLSIVAACIFFLVIGVGYSK